ncbi:hypothetical protein ACW95P_01925 [Candidatus Mycoplasma pogonae]
MKINKKIKKYLSLLGIIVVPIFYITTVSSMMSFSKKEDRQIENSELNENKIIKRKINKKTNYSLNLYGQIKQKKEEINQIKILLNYEVENNDSIDGDVSFFTSKNSYFLNLILPLLKNVKSYEISRLTPVVWIDFNDSSFDEKNFKTISNLQFILKVTYFKEKKENLEKINTFWLKENNPNEKFIAFWDPKLSELPDGYMPSKNEMMTFFSSNWNIEHLEKINFLKQRKKENDQINYFNYLSSIGRIGILEAANGYVEKSGLFRKKYVNTFLKEKNNYTNHANLVASIAGSPRGVDRYTAIFSAGFTRTNSDWQKNLSEWL